MGSAPEFTVRVDSRNDVTSIAAAGELDTSTVSILKDHLEATQDVQTVVVDLRDLSFIDSAGCRALLEAHESVVAEGHRLLVIGARPSARRLFHLLSIEFLLDSLDTASTLDEFTGGNDVGWKHRPMPWVRADG